MNAGGGSTQLPITVLTLGLGAILLNGAMVLLAIDDDVFWYRNVVRRQARRAPELAPAGAARAG